MTKTLGQYAIDYDKRWQETSLIENQVLAMFHKSQPAPEVACDTPTLKI